MDISKRTPVGCERGGMADTAVLEAAAERRGGSSPFVRTI